MGAEIPWRDFSLALPALFTVMLMPLTWSITNGIAGGVILYTILHARRAGPVAYAYLSAAGDFQVSQVVDRTTGIHALIRKADIGG